MLAAASLELKAEKQSAHSNYVRSVAFSPDGKTIVSGSYDQTIKVWEVHQALPTPADANLSELKRLAIARGYPFADVKKKNSDELQCLLDKGETLHILNWERSKSGVRVGLRTQPTPPMQPM